MSTVNYSWRSLVALFGALVLILGMAVSPASAVPLDEGSSSGSDAALTPDAETTPSADTSEVVTPESLQSEGASRAPEQIGDVAESTITSQLPVAGATSPTSDIQALSLIHI